MELQISEVGMGDLQVVKKSRAYRVGIFFSWDSGKSATQDSSQLVSA